MSNIEIIETNNVPMKNETWTRLKLMKHEQC